MSFEETYFRITFSTKIVNVFFYLKGVKKEEKSGRAVRMGDDLLGDESTGEFGGSQRFSGGEFRREGRKSVWMAHVQTGFGGGKRGGQCEPLLTEERVE